MLLSDVGDYLTSQGAGTWTQATNLFLGGQPPQPDACLTIYESQGQPSVHTFAASPGQAVVERPVIQVVARAAEQDYEAARLNAHKAFVLLDGLRDRTINGVRYNWMRARQSPFLMGLDKEKRPLVGFNVDVTKRLSTG